MHMLTRGLIVGVVLVTLLGCKKKDKAADDEPAAEGSTSDLTSDRSMQVMNAYVDFFNEVLDSAPDTLDNYWKRAGDKPLTVDTMTKWGNVICAGAGWMKMQREQSKDQVDKVKRLSSGEFEKMPPLAEAMYTSAVAYVDQRDAMCAYVKGGKFKDDQGAGAAAIHDGIVKARDAWNTSVDALAAELDRVQDAQAAAELAKFEGDKGYGYWFRFVTIRANEYLRLARRDPAAADANLPALQEAVTGFHAFLEGKGATVNETFAGYGKQVDRFAAAAEKLKGKPSDDGFDALVDAYNTMISLHNTLIAAEGRGDLK